jgi:hypothetical protein
MAAPGANVVRKAPLLPPADALALAAEPDAPDVLEPDAEALLCAANVAELTAAVDAAVTVDVPSSTWI